MRAFSFPAGHWSVSNLFVQAWRRWTARADQLLEAARLGSDKLEYLTCDGEMSNSGLGMVAGAGVDDLLRRRMLALELDSYELALSDPALLRHLQGRCPLCESRDACAADLARASANRPWPDRDEWRDYCENAAALEMLIALRSRSKTPPKYIFPHVP